MIELSLIGKILDGEELIYICERHFADEDIQRTKTGQKDLRLEEVPTKNLSAKSQDQLPKTERREFVRIEILLFFYSLGRNTF